MKNLHAPHRLHFLSDKGGRSKLAHWPPPTRGKETKLVAIAPEPAPVFENALPDGLRLTRASLGEFKEGSNED